jgi:hypothetical protein
MLAVPGEGVNNEDALPYRLHENCKEDANTREKLAELLHPVVCTGKAPRSYRPPKVSSKLVPVGHCMLTPCPKVRLPAKVTTT